MKFKSLKILPGSARHISGLRLGSISPSLGFVSDRMGLVFLMTGLTLISDISHISGLTVGHVVSDNLFPSIGQQHRVFAISVVSGSGLFLAEVVAAVSVFHFVFEVVVGGSLKLT